jgi:hypothetical protein
MKFETTRIITTIKTLTRSAKLPLPEIFYLSVSTTLVSGRKTVFNLLPAGPTNILQTSLSPLYKDALLKNYVGDCMSSITVYNTLPKPTKFSSTASMVFKMTKGDIGVAYAPFLRKIGSYYDIENNVIEIAPIVYGTGAYLNMRGFVGIASNTSSVKMILIFASS